MAEILSSPNVYLPHYPAVVNYHATFLGGMARVLDLAGTLTPPQRWEFPLVADGDAIRGDWGVVGADLLQALQSHAPELVSQRANPKATLPQRDR